MTRPRGSDAEALQMAASLLSDCVSRDAALDAVRYEMAAHGADRAWWQRVHDAVEDLGTVSDLARSGRANARL